MLKEYDTLWFKYMEYSLRYSHIWNISFKEKSFLKRINSEDGKKEKWLRKTIKIKQNSLDVMPKKPKSQMS